MTFLDSSLTYFLPCNILTHILKQEAAFCYVNTCISDRVTSYCNQNQNDL